MHSALTFLTLLLIGVNSQNLFEDIFNMNMGLPNLPPDNETSVLSLNTGSDFSVGREENPRAEESIFNMNMGLPNLPSDNETSVMSLNTESALPVAPKENPPGCGYRNVNGAGSSTTAMDESEAHFGEFPWMVAILKRRTIRRMIQEIYECSGSLIHPKVVLTAAHHVLTGRSADYKVRAGEWEPHRQSEEFPHQDQSVSYKILHPRFNRPNLYFDIALLFLEEPFDLTPSIGTICLAPTAQSVDSSPCYVSGWGVKASDRDPPSVLKKIELTIVPNPQCERDLRAAVTSHPNFALHSSFMCAGGELDKDACLGDGGAPLMCPITNSTNRYYQAGIVSWGLGCGEAKVPGVYTNLRFIRPWIDEQLAARRIQSSFYLPE